MLINEHSDANTGHVEPIEEVVDAMLNCLINWVGFPKLDNTFGHGGYDIGMSITNLHQRLAKSGILYAQKY